MKQYSAVVFNMDVMDETSKQIEQFLKMGTKVFFFTYEAIDSLRENNFLNIAVENQMLFLYEVRYDEKIISDFIYFDGNIPKPILNLLSKNAPHFNKDQFLIEHAPLNENIIVSAGAGTGKTTVMINRIFYLKYKNPSLSFSQMGLITFTNKSARHMREKLTEKLKVYLDLTKDLRFLNWMQEIKHMTIGTIHYFAEKILQYNRENLLLHQDMRISQFNYKRRKMIEEAIDSFNIENPEIYKRFKYIEQYKIINSVEMIIDQLMNHSISLEKFHDMDFGLAEDDSHLLYDYVVKETCKRLIEYKQSVKSMDVTDLIVAMDMMVERDDQYNIPFQYLIVDEFQDTDRVQTKFFAYLANHYSVHLFVVGDVKQSIYRFRGADYTAFKQLREQTTIHQIYFLQLNYRTDKLLLEDFNKLFSVWPKYVSNFNYDDRDQLLSGFQSETAFNSLFIIKRFQTKPGLVNFLKEKENTDTAVLVRSNKEVNELSRLCEDNKIFYISEQDGDFYRSLPVREFYLLLRRFTHPNHWRNRYALHQSSYGERMLEIESLLESFSPDRTARSLLSSVDLRLEKFEDRLRTKPIFQVITEIMDEIDPARVYAERYTSNKSDGKLIEQARVLYTEYQMNLDHLLYQLKVEMQHSVPTLFGLEKALRIKMCTDKTMSKLYKTDADMKRLSVMTVHKAKGLEFDQVFLPNTSRSFFNSLGADVIVNEREIGYKVYISDGKTYENDIYQKSYRIERTEDIGEETRLLYVALTRAKKAVFVNAPEHTNNTTVKNWGDLIAKGLSEGISR